MPGLIEGGVAVLFAAAMYGLFYAVAGTHLRRAITADEGPGLRAFYAVAVVVLSAIVWVMVGAVVYWGALIWFRFFLQEYAPWRQQILGLTSWFPAGLLVATGVFRGESGRALAVVLGYPAALFLAAGATGVWRRARRERDPDTRPTAGGVIATLDSAEERR